MRSFEILTLILATGSFVALKTHPKRKVFLYLLFITSLCSILQYYFEGSRWQFTPVTYSLPLMYVFHKVNNQSLTPLKSSFLIFMLISGFILSSTIPVFQLPNPGGPHKIGTHTFHWVDSLRYEHFTHEDTTDFREIIVQTWFPTKDVQELEPEPYLDFIERNDITSRIHGPVGPQSSKWAKNDSRTGQELLENMTEYMTELSKKLNDINVVKWMDVVNETITTTGQWHGEREGDDKWENPWKPFPIL